MVTFAEMGPDLHYLLFAVVFALEVLRQIVNLIGAERFDYRRSARLEFFQIWEAVDLICRLWLFDVESCLFLSRHLLKIAANFIILQEVLGHLPILGKMVPGLCYSVFAFLRFSSVMFL